MVDNRTRPQGVNQVELRFLRDVAASIMAHLDLTRCQTTHRRGVRMVRGLSRFMEGKDTIYDDGSSTSGPSLSQSQQHGSYGTGKEGSDRTNALGAASNAERVIDAGESLNDNVRTQLRYQDEARWKPVSAKGNTKSRPSSQQQGSTTKLTRNATSLTAVAQLAQQPSPNQLQEDAISEGIGRAFERAARLIQQAMDMAGVVFLDASAGEFGTLKSHAENESSGSSHNSSRAESKSGTDTPLQSDSERTVRSDDGRPGSPPRLKVCRYLGTAYAENEDVSHRGIPEKFLRSLQRRFPYGKICESCLCLRTPGIH